MSLLGKKVKLNPTQGVYQKILEGVVVSETATQFEVTAEGIRPRKFRKADGMPVAKLHRQFPCYKAELVE